MAGIQFGQQLDLNTNKITELAPGTAGTDAVNLDQLDAVAGGLGFTATVGDGVALTFNLNHALDLDDKNAFVIRVAEVASGAEINVENVGVDADNATVTFGVAPTSDQYFVAILPVR